MNNYNCDKLFSILFITALTTCTEFSILENCLFSIADKDQQAVESLIYDSKDTRSEDAIRNHVEWLQQTGENPQLKRLNIYGTYPKEACNLKLEGYAVYNVQVNAQGNSSPTPALITLIKSSGYAILNQRGLQNVRSLYFSQSTQVTVMFKPDSNICSHQ